jgi:hypothetical protein
MKAKNHPAKPRMVKRNANPIKKTSFLRSKVPPKTNHRPTRAHMDSRKSNIIFWTQARSYTTSQARCPTVVGENRRAFSEKTAKNKSSAIADFL